MPSEAAAVMNMEAQFMHAACETNQQRLAASSLELLQEGPAAR